MADSGRKVLIADDEVEVHEFVKEALADGGYEVITASDGEEAAEKCRSEKPDLLILDVQMPKKIGFSVFDELRRDEATKAIPVIILTAITARTGIPYGADEIGEFFGSEPEAYLDKPIDPGKLQETVARLLQ